ncbi:MAG: hypothetical protein F6K36_01670 [Symploca sp. SIO3C6]|uniref:Uncharacterized protein n=1 Tax=Symploca sp. SIO1C4 TaxID=2607765 RepID=A0A6B3NLA9_9CYAN|nr:hypothetical protein [Symploca sp. SIO3C6]NER30361.1 hypothetical protein [Symploca sp. SIO1C4]
MLTRPIEKLQRKFNSVGSHIYFNDLSSWRLSLLKQFQGNSLIRDLQIEKYPMVGEAGKVNWIIYFLEFSKNQSPPQNLLLREEELSFAFALAAVITSA